MKVKIILIGIMMVVLWLLVFGSGMPLNALKINKEEVEAIELLDDWGIISPTKVTEKDDIERVLNAINSSKRSGIISDFTSGGYPFCIRFQLKNEEIIDFIIFRVSPGTDSQVDFENGMMKMHELSSLLEFESSIYLLCVELADKYNPDENSAVLNKWIEKGYKTVLN